MSIDDYISMFNLLSNEEETQEFTEQDAAASTGGATGGGKGYPTVTKWETGLKEEPQILSNLENGKMWSQLQEEKPILYCNFFQVLYIYKKNEDFTIPRGFPKFKIHFYK